MSTRTMRLCTVEGCTNKHRSNGYCIKHHRRWLRWGDPLIKKHNGHAGNTEADFHAQLVPSEQGCLEFQGTRGDYGHGQFTWEGQRWLTHRLAWTLANGPIPAGLFVLHRCDNPPCCNVDHLFLGTQTDNRSDCVDKERHARGETIWTARLTEEAVREIRASYTGAWGEKAELARQYGVSQAQIGNVTSRRQWTHI